MSELEQSKIINGIVEIKFKDWSEFSEFLINEFSDNDEQYVFRGQEDISWVLEPSFDLIVKELKIEKNVHEVAEKHLAAFKRATQGRRGVNPPLNDDDDYWWALGRHYGLCTPLLDWTNSPFVASFFAFEKANKKSDYVSISSLRITAIKDRSDYIEKRFGEGKGIKFISPNMDENPRMISQVGLFTRAPFLCPIEDWVTKYYKDENKAGVLARFLVPSRYKDHALKALHNMNINHLSLFPDLMGSSMFCNSKLGIKNYHYFDLIT